MNLKYRAIIVLFVLTFHFTSCFAQGEKVSLISSSRLNICCNRTTNLIFPFPIQSVDRGTTDVLVEKVSGIENVLHVKAAKPNFSETNLSVITTDGKLYSFLVDYASEPRELNIAFQKDTGVVNVRNTSPNESILFSDANSNEKALNEIAQKVCDSKRTKYGVKNKHDAMQLFLYGLYIQNDVFYFQFKIENKSDVSYDADAIRFFIKDQQKSIRTATQETEIQPIYIYGNYAFIKGKCTEKFVVALPKFILQDQKNLVIQILEKNGGRDLHLTLNNFDVMQAHDVKQ